MGQSSDLQFLRVLLAIGEKCIRESAKIVIEPLRIHERIMPQNEQRKYKQSQTLK